ncbi:unnamed protein product [Camellia sinensis]
MQPWLIYFRIWSESHDVLGVVDDTDILYFTKANGEEITRITKKHLKVSLPIMGLIVHDSSDMNKSCFFDVLTSDGSLHEVEISQDPSASVFSAHTSNNNSTLKEFLENVFCLNYHPETSLLAIVGGAVSAPMTSSGNTGKLLPESASISGRLTYPKVIISPQGGYTSSEESHDSSNKKATTDLQHVDLVTEDAYNQFDFAKLRWSLISFSKRSFANRHRLDKDEVLKSQWLCSARGINEIIMFLSAIKDQAFVLSECVDGVGPTEDTVRASIAHGLHLTNQYRFSETEVDENSQIWEFHLLKVWAKEREVAGLRASLNTLMSETVVHRSFAVADNLGEVSANAQLGCIPSPADVSEEEGIDFMWNKGQEFKQSIGYQLLRFSQLYGEILEENGIDLAEIKVLRRKMEEIAISVKQVQRLNCPEAAMQSLQLARQHASSEHERLVYEGWILYDMGHCEEGLRKVEDSISLMRSFEAFFLKAYALADSSHDSSCSSTVISLLQDALKCPSDRLRKGQALNNLGSVYVDCGKLDLAVDCYIDALKIRHIRAHQGLARVHFLRNNKTATYEEMTKLIEKARNNVSAYEKRSEYSERELTKADLEMVTHLDPLRVYPYRYRAAVLMDNHKEKEAIAELSRAIAFKANLNLLHLRAAFHEHIGDVMGALRDY